MQIKQDPGPTEESPRRLMDAVVVAGGRISGCYARAARTTVKALVPVGGQPVILHVVETLRAASGIGRVCVVGPEAVRKVLSKGCCWQRETGSAFGNMLAGIQALGVGEQERVLICGSDLPALNPAAVQDLLERAPTQADFCLPLVRKEPFMTLFPRSLRLFGPLVEGRFTVGSQFLLKPWVLHAHQDLSRNLYQQRKNSFAMARTLGAAFLWKLLTFRLSVAEIEAGVSRRFGCQCCAIPDCCPELAFDIDNVLALYYIRRWMNAVNSR